MSWHPNDLVTDVDLKDYEERILEDFGQTTWQARRTKALEDWLFPILRTRGFDPFALRTRAEFDAAYSFISSAYADVTGVLTSTTNDDLNLATVFATPSTDALFLGSTQPFRGLFVRMADSVSAVTATLSVAYWNGSWEPLNISDGTSQTTGKAFSGAGAVTWLLPVDWVTRAVNNSATLYWVKVTISATPTSAKAGQIGAIRSSVFRGPATFRTLQLIMAEAPTGNDGPWRDKQAFYATEADTALARALEIAGGEFDTDASDQISTTEAEQTPEEAGGGAWTLERA